MARNPNTTTAGQPFDEKKIEAVWQKGTPEPNYPGFRNDTRGEPKRRNLFPSGVSGKTVMEHPEAKRMIAASFYFYNTETEVERLIEVVRDIQRFFGA